ncbi:MAG: GNAT family N-acetyltransferase [Syntrophobacterales bacterium]|nr:GNAT family N-acetyltransferase [Syntrophobacterales bacterium]
MGFNEIGRVLKNLGISQPKFITYSSIKEINPIEWNLLAEDAAPMMEWEYFYILEESQTIGPSRGFFPLYIGLYDSRGTLIGIAPMFERPHGSNEFGLTGLMNDISLMTGVPVGRGLMGSVPFTPVPVYQFLVRDKSRERLVWELFLRYIDFICETRGLYSARLYFLSPTSSHLHDLLSLFGYMGLVSTHFLWINRYGSYDEFLKTLGAHRRRNILREIRKLKEMNVEIELLPGTDVDPSTYSMILEAYESTWRKHMPPETRPYLRPAFFSLLKPFFQHRCLFSIAKKSRKIVGLALFYHKGDTMFGRYWGSFEETPYLHFGTCYYWPMMHAVERGIKYVDPGFGGEHKALRGFGEISVYHYVKFYGHQSKKCYRALENIIGCHLAL